MSYSATMSPGSCRPQRPATGCRVSRSRRGKTDLGEVDVLANIPDVDGTRLDYDTLAEHASEVG